jgi:hypothetical protein
MPFLCDCQRARFQLCELAVDPLSAEAQGAERKARAKPSSPTVGAGIDQFSVFLVAVQGGH